MTKCVVKFEDGTFVNIRADGMIEEEDGVIQVFRRNSPAEIAERSACYEIVGKFRMKCVSAIYLSETKD